MRFERKIYAKLRRWKEEAQGTKALLIEGARRIGKSTIAEAFAQSEYESYLLIDFSVASQEVKGYFQRYVNDLDTLFMLLFASYGKRLTPRRSLVIFDEVEFCPKAREAIKTLVKDGRYDYLETGSLISIHENVEGILIPSEERSIKMHPLDFEEFLWASGEKPLSELIKACYARKEALPKELHEKAMLLWRQYVLVGGMPMSVAAFLGNGKSFAKADAEKRDVLALYRADIMKIKSANRAKVLALFDQIPGFLSQHDRQVSLSEIKKGGRYENYEEAFFWLEDSAIANECYLCRDPNVGLSLNEDRSSLKCYLCDTGLLVSHAFDENDDEGKRVYDELILGDLSVNEGMFYENAIAQTLVSNGYKLYFYSHYSIEKHRNDIEVDFLISSGGKAKSGIIPIEVKSGKTYATKSLDRFVEKFKDRVDEVLVIHPRNLTRKENGTLCIPSYMAFCL